MISYKTIKVTPFNETFSDNGSQTASTALKNQNVDLAGNGWVPISVVGYNFNRQTPHLYVAHVVYTAADGYTLVTSVRNMTTETTIKLDVYILCYYAG